MCVRWRSVLSHGPLTHSWVAYNATSPRLMRTRQPLASPFHACSMPSQRPSQCFLCSTAQLYASLAVGIITHGFLAASIYLLSHTEMDPHGINLLQIINGFVPVVFAAMLPGKGDSVVAKRLGPGDRVPTHHRTRREIIADLIHEGNQEQGAAAVDRKKTQ